jgi:non-specific serine/threonine protein kinase
MFSDALLRQRAGEAVFSRGLKYFQGGYVSLKTLEIDYASMQVQGSYRSEYLVEFHARSSERLSGECQCEHFADGNFCKHLVAAALFLRRQLEASGSSDLQWKAPLQNLVELAQEAHPGGAIHRPYFLMFSIREQPSGYQIEPMTLRASEVLSGNGVGVGELAATSKFSRFIQKNPWLGLQAKRAVSTLDSSACVNADARSVTIANVIARSERQFSGYFYYSYSRPIEDYLALLAGVDVPVFLGTNQNPLAKPVKIRGETGLLTLRLSRSEAGITLEARATVGDAAPPLERNRVRQLGVDPVWVAAGSDVFRLNGSTASGILQKLLAVPLINVPKRFETEFLETYLVPIANTLPLEGEQIAWETVRAQPVPRLYLMEDGQELLAQLRFAYGEYEVPFIAEMPETTIRQKSDGSWTLVKIVRHPGAEGELHTQVSSARHGLKRFSHSQDASLFSLRARVDAVDFLLKHIPALAEDGFEVYGEEDLKSARVNRNTPTLSLTVSSGLDWFDLVALVKFGDMSVSLKEVRRALRKSKRYVKLADGTIGELPEAWVEKYKHIFGLGEQTDEGTRLSKYHASLIEEFIGEVDQAQVDAEFRRRAAKLRSFAGIEPHYLPDGFTGELRPYQKAGFDWLHFLKDYGFGGCLADDMGLGKTVQVLAFLQSLAENGSAGRASLVVVPRSLLFNWQREAERFTPRLRVVEYFGQGRERDTAAFDNADVLITTYGTMRRDLNTLKGYQFNYIVLDESQAIKNPLSQVSKAARLLNGRHRLVMTGTPVENSTFELWSQFAFLNPGLLGGIEYFKREFAGPIERKQDERAARLLRKLVHPFILRRTKDQVAPELPPRTERVMYCDMEPAQKKAYERTRDYYRGLLLGMIEEQGLNDTRMKILEGLLRLRQICNHPRLVDGEFRGDSAKMVMLVEQLNTLRAEGHKALVFSQFVQMLNLVRRELDERKIPYAYLDGQTTDRQARVDQFQADPSIPFFLISLRAGGVGLNLTAADYVIHIDPWWNPAVEMQATDRTHRIGQDKPVFVYKLISRGTVEEKILQLQEKKKTLVDQLITTEANFIKALTAADVKLLFS